MSIEIGPGTQVTLHFELRFPSGEVVDSTFDYEPATLVIGDGNLLPGFEAALFGLTSGVRETLVIPPEKGFGQPNPNNIHTMPAEQFSDIQLEKGLVLSFADAQNAELPGVVADFDEQEVTIDFNHPLAGKDIHFEVEVINVTPSVTH